MDNFILDYYRARRTGLEEAVFCSEKTVAEIKEIVDSARNKGIRLLLTRLLPEQWNVISESQGDLDYDETSQTAFLGETRELSALEVFCVVTAGSSDRKVAQEAVRTLNYYGHQCPMFCDLGVAGLWRLTERIDEITKYPIVLAVAGMDAAMPTVLSGLVPSAIIGVPTSSGYGVADGGRAALNSMLASCSPGIAVVNIDNGFGGACIALRFLNSLEKVSNIP
ncbi:MAG: hypothetical protein CFH06_01680 [Alphaproteobacteria bacterium MarineAlpha3_Bin5]|nr:circadian phase modifier CpmA [Magnetovibrio sp.]PPR76707.1 MAG: hypothetical protein CFH06_01680 [Alphaproteobacteria bacterium MarineAlpha3_Bin5]